MHLVPRHRGRAAATMVNDTLLLSTRNHFERRRYRCQIRDASNERSVSESRREESLPSRGHRFRATSRTSWPTLGSIVFPKIFQSRLRKVRVYGLESSLRDPPRRRTSTPKIANRANSVADNVPILFRLCITA